MLLVWCSAVGGDRGHGSKATGAAAGEVVEGGGGGGVSGEIDEQALVVAVAEVERLEAQAERADVGVGEGVDAGPAGDERPLQPAAGELLTTDGGEGVGERVDARRTSGDMRDSELVGERLRG